MRKCLSKFNLNIGFDNVSLNIQIKIIQWTDIISHIRGLI